MAKGKKTGGREKGTPNKLTKELRASIKDILDGELESLPEQLEKLEPKERIELLIKLMPYVVPKVESVNHSHDEPFEL